MKSVTWTGFWCAFLTLRCLLQVVKPTGAISDEEMPNYFNSSLTTENASYYIYNNETETPFLETLSADVVPTASSEFSKLFNKSAFFHVTSDAYDSNFNESSSNDVYDDSSLDISFEITVPTSNYSNSNFENITETLQTENNQSSVSTNASLKNRNLRIEATAAISVNNIYSTSFVINDSLHLNATKSVDEDFHVYSTVENTPSSTLTSQDEYSLNRVLRSVFRDNDTTDSSPQIESSKVEYGSSTPVPESSVLSLPTIPLNSVEVELRPKQNESHRENKQSIDDIISEIVHLLGGNVRVGKPPDNFRVRNGTAKKKPSGTRINDRGPPNFTVVTVTPSTAEPNPTLHSWKPNPTLHPPWKIPSDNVSFILGLTETFVPLKESTDKSVFNIKPTSTMSSFSTTLNLPQPSETQLSSNVTQSSTKVWEGTATQTKLHPTQSKQRPVTEKTEIVYGRPSDNVKVPDMKEIRPTKTSTIPSTSKIKNNTKVTTPSTNKTYSNLPTGRPIVIPVEIEEVRPFVGPIPNDFGGRPPMRPPGAFGPPGYPNNNRLPPNGPPGPPIRQPPTQRRPTNTRPRPNTPLVRIDTCIVGDESTCDAQLNERCITEMGISSCHCRPGFSRNFPRGPCIPVVSISLALKVDRFGEQILTYNPSYADSQTQDYQLLENEAKQAFQTLFGYTSYSRTFMGATINNFYPSGGKFIINSTISLEENASNRQPANQRLLQEELKDAITSRNLKIGDSKLYVANPLHRWPAVEDFNECDTEMDNDCSSNGICENVFGSFRCRCKPGYIDKSPDDQWKSGRSCSLCSPAFCNNHGECVIRDKQRICECKGKYIGSKCEIDGEVLGVALGASLAALVIIILTLSCLCIWNRRMERQEHKRCGSSSASQCCTFDKKASVPAYRLTVEDRRRWAHIANAMGNVYVQPDHMLPPPSLPPPPPPSSAHVYSTPSRLLLQNMENDRNRIYGHIRPKSRSSHTGADHGGGGYYDLNDFPTREEYRSPRMYSQHH